MDLVWLLTVLGKIRFDTGNSVDITDGNLVLACLTATFDIQSVEFWSEIINTQVNLGTGYTGPITLTTVAVTANGDLVNWDWDDFIIPGDVTTGFGACAAVAVFYDTGDPETSPVILRGVPAIQFGNGGGNVNFNVNAAGVLDR